MLDPDVRMGVQSFGDRVPIGGEAFFCTPAGMVSGDFPLDLLLPLVVADVDLGLSL